MTDTPPSTDSLAAAASIADMFGGVSLDRFEFQMTEALIGQVVTFMAEKLSWATLDAPTLEMTFQGNWKAAQGIYMLGRRMKADTPPPPGLPAVAVQDVEQDGRWTRVIYVGQSERTIVSRLRKHSDFIRDRVNLADLDVVFKACEVIIFNSVGIEGHLIPMFGTKWRADDLLSGWNNSGFGSNDTGTNRDQQKPSKFDQRFPIDLFRLHNDVFGTGGAVRPAR